MFSGGSGPAATPPPEKRLDRGKLPRPGHRCGRWGSGYDRRCRRPASPTSASKGGVESRVRTRKRAGEPSLLRCGQQAQLLNFQQPVSKELTSFVRHKLPNQGDDL